MISWIASSGTFGLNFQFLYPLLMVLWWCHRFAISVAVEQEPIEDWFSSVLIEQPGAFVTALQILLMHIKSIYNKYIHCRIQLLMFLLQRGPSTCCLRWTFQLWSVPIRKHDEVWEHDQGQAPSWEIVCLTVAAFDYDQMAEEQRDIHKVFSQLSTDACLGHLLNWMLIDGPSH